MGGLCMYIVCVKETVQVGVCEVVGVGFGVC